jgi:hypothetical protein
MEKNGDSKKYARKKGGETEQRKMNDWNGGGEKKDDNEDRRKENNKKDTTVTGERQGDGNKTSNRCNKKEKDAARKETN